MRRKYLVCDAAGQDVYDDIEVFDNPNRKQPKNAMLSLIDPETEQSNMNEAGVWKTRGISQRTSWPLLNNMLYLAVRHISLSVVVIVVQGTYRHHLKSG